MSCILKISKMEAAVTIHKITETGMLKLLKNGTEVLLYLKGRRIPICAKFEWWCGTAGWNTTETVHNIPSKKSDRFIFLSDLSLSKIK